MNMESEIMEVNAEEMKMFENVELEMCEHS